MTPPPTLQELIDTVWQDAGTDDPVGQLAVASATAGALEQTTDALLGHFVDRCRRAGRSWSEISTALGVSKQAVHKRFAGPLAERLVAMTGRPTFERFTQRARHVVAESGQAAVRLGDDFVGTEHLLLALFSEPGGLASKALAAMNVSRESVQAAIEASADRTADLGEPAARVARATDRPAGATPLFSGAAKLALRDALTVALELGHNYIGTEHILLGLYRQPDSLAARVLAELGPEPAEVQVRVAELLRGFA
jgi:ATP-dependent Clp protease ATP-binding subunit ClpA